MIMQARSSDQDHLHWLQKFGIKLGEGQSVLDVGCGSGYLCHIATTEGAKHVVGMDIVSPEGLAPDSKWMFIKTDLNAGDWISQVNGKKFNLIFAFDILEHLDSPYKFLSDLRSCAAQNANVVITTPNVMSWERFIRPNTWSGVQDHQHKTLFTRYSLEFLLWKSGFITTTMKAPVRSLGPLGYAIPQIGGQIICIARAMN
jgi:2-polyprenyl-3-methyl-5-hydroxy-6-metoxy-1,4-benzoquinol methylase